MDVLKIIYDYPEVFNTEEKRYSIEDAVNLISSCNSKGSEFQKAYFIISSSYTAFRKLLKLGLRKPAIEFGNHMLERSLWYQQYEYAALFAKYLCQHFYLFEEKEKALVYNEKYKLYRKVEDLEFESEMLYSELIYNTTTTGDINKVHIEKSLKNIESKLLLDSCIHKYYYYQCKSLISENVEKKQCYENAITYFENLYFKHDGFLNIFRKNLVRYHIENKEYEIALTLINGFSSNLVKWSRSWIIFMFYEAKLQIELNNYALALDKLNTVIQSQFYSAIPEQEKIEWESLKNICNVKDEKRFNLGSDIIGIDDPTGI